MMYTEFGGNVSGKYFMRNVYVPNDNNVETEKQKFIKRCNGTDVYQCIYLYDTDKKEDISKAPLLAPFYLDMDADIESNDDYIDIRDKTVRLVYILHSVLSIPISQIQIYFSGHKGFHVLIHQNILGITKSLDRLNDIYKAWAIHLSMNYDIPNLDIRIYDRRRLFRIPNTINGKTGLFKVWLPFETLKDSTYDFIKEYASAPKFFFPMTYTINKVAATTFLKKAKLVYERQPFRKSTYQIPKAKMELKPCIKELLEEGVAQGSRNKMTVLLANTLLQHGYSEDDTRNIVYHWNQENDPPLSESELERTINSAFDMIHDGKMYGCSVFQEAGLCKADCKLNNLKKERVV